MSMLSAQMDKLRKAAQTYRDLGNHETEQVLLDAADTIWELRNKCADLVGERERLFRANVEKNNEMLRLVRDNARLRELVADLYNSIDSVFWDGEVVTKERFKRRMRELGVEA